VKAVILAGGLGTRLGEETELRPKPMVEIGGMPILWHILKIYSAGGINDFVICCGYRGYMIKEFFANYFLHNADVTFDISNNKMEVHTAAGEPWRVTLVDTGSTTQTGGRIRRIRRYVENDPLFCLTYGDGVADIDMRALIDFHRKQAKACTLTAVQPAGRFGTLRFDQRDESRVAGFEEKPKGDATWVNGGFFVAAPKIFDLLEDDNTIWERAPLESLTKSGQLSAYRHHGFWYAMDSLRDKNVLNDLWATGEPPWKVW
jgi:glucose-1-phosphate cytidylyltransferase